MLDISEFYDVKVDVLSGIFVVGSVGSVVGSFFSEFLFLSISIFPIVLFGS